MEPMEYRILFAGTSEIAVDTLRALAGNFNVVGVLTATDKPVGRSKALVSPAVKVAADELGIKVIQCEHVNRAEREAVEALGADFLVSFSFGRIFGPKFLGIFRHTMNIHPSCLPEARGCSPVQAAILSGRRKWAVSYQEIGLEMDCGKIYDVLEFELNGKETYVTLSEAIAPMAAGGAVKVVESLQKGLCSPVVQEGEPSFCTMISKADGLLDFHRSALEVHSRIRAMYDWPKAYAFLDGSQVMVTGVWGGFDELDAEPFLEEGTGCGTVLEIRKGKGLRVACADKAVWLTRVQLPTKKEITYLDFANSKKNLVGKCFTGQ